MAQLFDRHPQEAGDEVHANLQIKNVLTFKTNVTTPNLLDCISY